MVGYELALIVGEWLTWLMIASLIGVGVLALLVKALDRTGEMATTHPDTRDV